MRNADFHCCYPDFRLGGQQDSIGLLTDAKKPPGSVCYPAVSPNILCFAGLHLLYNDGPAGTE